MVRRGWRDMLHLGNASAEAKATRSVHLGRAAPAGPSKTSLASCRPHRSCLAFKLNKTTTNPVLRIHCGILFLIRHITTHFSHKIHRNLPCIRCIRGCWGTPSGLRPSALATSAYPLATFATRKLLTTFVGGT